MKPHLALARRFMLFCGQGQATKNHRGIIYLLSLGVVFLFTTLGVSMLTRSLTQMNVSQRAFNQSAAFQLADASIDQAAINLRTGDIADDVLAGTFPIGLSSTGTFTILSVVPVNAQTQQVTTRGSVGGEQRDIEAIIQLTPRSVFQWSVFGDKNVTVQGSTITDSYDSRNGAYNDDPGSPLYNAGHDGDIGTNGTTSGAINFTGNKIFIDGQVAVGPNVADPTTVIAGYDSKTTPSLITGGTSPPTDTQDVVSQSSPFPMPPVTLPASCTGAPNLKVEGNATTTLSGGNTYCYHNLTLEGGATFTADGPVTIYITGRLIVRGNNTTVGVSSAPKNMIFLMDSSASTVIEDGTITGSTKFYGAVYGPASEFEISGDAEVFGSIISEKVTVKGNAVIHYDKGLSDTTTVSNSYRSAVTAWREL